MKSKIPLILLILAGVVFSFNYMDRYDLPLHDEALYSVGNYSFMPNWGPLYQFVYFVLNKLTGSYIDSFYILLYSLTFFILPLSIYVFCQRLKFSPNTSSLIAGISLLSYWNFPSNPKIQVFNFSFLLLALISRTKNKPNYLSYTLITASLFIRQDNLILLVFLLGWDGLNYLRKKEFKYIIAATGTILIVFLLGTTIFKYPFHNSRTWLAFRDHFYWRNEKVFERDKLQSLSINQSEKRLFGENSSLLEAYKTHPELLNTHFLQNLYELPHNFIRNFNLVILDGHHNGSKSTFFLYFLIFTLLITAKRNGPLPLDIIPISMGLFIKCLLIAILLQPMDKYIFELNVIFLIILSYLVTKINSQYRWKDLPYISIPLVVLLFFSYKEPVFREEVSLNEIVLKIREIDQKNKIKSTLSNMGVHHWSDLKCSNLNLWVNRGFDFEIKKDIKKFLEDRQIDVIVLEPNMRNLIKDVGLDSFFNQFEEHYHEMGLELIYGVPSEGASIYRSINSRI